MAMSLNAFTDTYLIFGTWLDAILKIELRDLSTYFYPELQRHIYFKEYIAAILKW